MVRVRALNYRNNMTQVTESARNPGFITSAIAWLPSITECYFDPKLPKKLPQITVLGYFSVMFRLQCVESVGVSPKRQREVLFQVGQPPEAVVHKARHMSSLGAMFLKMANYLSTRRHEYIEREMVRLYGNDVGKKWTPRLAVYDLILNHQV
jgi:heme/copper-type cytochrome/quinol oxidase subunit 1